jgi:hypothetical protein
MTMQGYWICKFCEHRNVREFEGLDTCEGCSSQVATTFTTEHKMNVKWQRCPPLAPVEVVPYAEEKKRFEARLKDIGSTDSHIERFYKLCEDQGHEIIALKAKFELLERALLRHNHE